MLPLGHRQRVQHSRGQQALRPDLHRDHRQGAGVPPRRAGVGGARRRQAGRPVLRRLLRPRGQALRRVGERLPPAVTAPRRGAAAGVEQQQLRQGQARRAGADLARRRRDPVPRVRPRAARPAVGRHLPEPVGYQHAARLRRVPVAGPRELGADAAEILDRFAPPLQDRASRCRRRCSTRSRRRRSSTRAT